MGITLLHALKYFSFTTQSQPQITKHTTSSIWLYCSFFFLRAREDVSKGYHPWNILAARNSHRVIVNMPNGTPQKRYCLDVYIESYKWPTFAPSVKHGIFCRLVCKIVRSWNLLDDNRLLHVVEVEKLISSKHNQRIQFPTTVVGRIRIFIEVSNASIGIGMHQRSFETVEVLFQRVK